MEFDGQKLKVIRNVAGLSQQELAEISGVRQDTISGLETGRHRPQARTLRKLAFAMGYHRVSVFYEQSLPEEIPGEVGSLSPSFAAQAAARRAEEHLEVLRGMAPEDYDDEANDQTWEVLNDLLDEIAKHERDGAGSKTLGRLFVRLARTAAKLLWRRIEIKHKETA